MTVKCRQELNRNTPKELFLIHFFFFQKREYPDGTTKILYDDGRMETRLPNGRVRIKDKDGNLVHDSNSSHSDGSMTIKV